jgi:uncharacterized membrane protein (UPF0127 family)
MQKAKEILGTITSNPVWLAVSLLVVAVILLLAVNEITKEPTLKDNAKVVVRIDKARLEAIVAKSAEERTKGLSGTNSLGANSGMLFISPNENPVIIMRDMNYPIDIIWITKGTVTEVTANVQPQPGVPTDQLTKYQPSGPADQILETNAGWASKHGVQPGDPVKINSL